MTGPGPVRVCRMPGRQTSAQVDQIASWVRANNIDPATVDGVYGVVVDYQERTLRWRDHVPGGGAGKGEPRTGPLLIEPSADLVDTVAVPSPPVRHRGLVLLDEEKLARMLRLPPEWRLIGFTTLFAQLAIGVHVEGDGLPECTPGDEAPIVELPRPAPGELAVGVAAAAAEACRAARHTDRRNVPVAGACVECVAAAVDDLLADRLA
jgi:hypothetical protein